MQLYYIILGSLFLLGGCNVVDIVLEVRKTMFLEWVAVQKYFRSVEIM